MAPGELKERQDFTQPILRMGEGEEGVKDEGERINIQSHFYCKHRQEDNEFWAWLLRCRLPPSRRRRHE